jgi:hypothetical protein
MEYLNKYGVFTFQVLYFWRKSPESPRVQDDVVLKAGGEAK